MTTRGIRRKKSYLVDAKIAVCGHKSIGKSGKCSVIETDIVVKQQTSRCDACSLQIFKHERNICVNVLTLNHFLEKKNSLLSFAWAKRNLFFKNQV